MKVKNSSNNSRQHRIFLRHPVPHNQFTESHKSKEIGIYQANNSPYSYILKTIPNDFTYGNPSTKNHFMFSFVKNEKSSIRKVKSVINRNKEYKQDLVGLPIIVVNANKRQSDYQRRKGFRQKTCKRLHIPWTFKPNFTDRSKEVTKKFIEQVKADFKYKKSKTAIKHKVEIIPKVNKRHVIHQVQDIIERKQVFDIKEAVSKVNTKENIKMQTLTTKHKDFYDKLTSISNRFYKEVKKSPSCLKENGDKIVTGTSDYYCTKLDDLVLSEAYNEIRNIIKRKFSCLELYYRNKLEVTFHNNEYIAIVHGTIR